MVVLSYLLLFMLCIHLNDGSKIHLTNPITTSNSILSRVESESIPIFDLASQIEAVTESGFCSEIELENIFTRYCDRLNEHYINDFEKRIEGLPSMEEKIVIQSYIEREFETAVRAAVPKCLEGKFNENVQVYDVKLS